MDNRVSLYPGRVKLTPVAGQENTYDMARADEPTQEGTPLNKGTLLDDDTCALLGLESTAVPTDVFAMLYLTAKQSCYVCVHVVDTNGNNVEGVVVDGISELDGSVVYTDSAGMVRGYNQTDTTTVRIKNCLGYTDVSETISTPIGFKVNGTLTTAKQSSGYRIITQSDAYRVAPFISTLTVQVLGAGSDGVMGYLNGGTRVNGGGGDGGFFKSTTLNANNTTAYSAIIGASQGSASSFGSVTSVGGTKAGMGGSGSYGDSGSGHGGNSTVTMNHIGVVGGGGGGAHFGNGGSPYGGKGNGNTAGGSAATGYGGGGGGGGYNGGSLPGGKGYQGVIVIDWSAT